MRSPGIAIVLGSLAGLASVAASQAGSTTPAPPEVVKLLPPRAANGFGNALSISSNGAFLAVGATRDEDGYGKLGGSAYVFDLATGDLVVKLTVPNGNSGERLLGCSVSISSDGARLAVGARLDDGQEPASGSAYVFDIPTGDLVVKLTEPQQYWDGQFGGSVSMSSDGARVAAGTRDSAYVFDVATGDVLAELPQLTEHGVVVVSISPDGARLAAGTPRSNSKEGSAYVLDIASGDLLVTLLEPEPAQANGFGGSVSMSSNGALVAVGVEQHYGHSAYVFDVATGDLVVKLTAPGGAGTTAFGEAVSISSDGARLVVGASKDESDEGIVWAGAAYVFDIPTGDLVVKLTPPDPCGHCFFGRSLSISSDGELVAMGASVFENGSRVHAAYFSSLSGPPTSTTTTLCQDSPLSWTDMYNNTCSTYAANGDCVMDGHSESDYDLPPSAACCTCGGGAVAPAGATTSLAPAPSNDSQWAKFGVATSFSGVGAGTYNLISHQFDDRVRGAVVTSLVSLESAFDWANASGAATAQPGGGSRQLGVEDNGFGVRMSLAPPRGASKRMMFKHLAVEALDEWRDRFQSAVDAEQLPRGVAILVEEVKIWLVRRGLMMIVSASGTSLSLLPDTGRLQKAFEEVVIGRVALSLVQVELQVAPDSRAQARALASGDAAAEALDMTVTSRVRYDESREAVEEYVSEKRDDIGSSMIAALTEEPFHVPNSTVNITIEPEFSSFVFEVGSEVLCQSNHHPCGESRCCPGAPRSLRCGGANNSGRPLRDIYQNSPPPTLSLLLGENRSAQFTADTCGWAGTAAEGSLIFAVDMGGSQDSLQPDSRCASRWPQADVNLLQASFPLSELSDAGGNCHLSGSESRIEGFVKLFLILNYASASMTITAWTWPVNITVGGPTETSASLEMLDIWGGGEVATPGAAVTADDSLKNVTSALKLCDDDTFSTEKVFPIFRMGDCAYVVHSPLGDLVKLTIQEVLLKDSSHIVRKNLTGEARLGETWRAEIPAAAFQVELPLCMGCHLQVRSAVSRMARSIGSASADAEQLSGVLLLSMIPPAQVTFNIQIVGLSHYSPSWNEALKRQVESALQAALAAEVAGEAPSMHVNVILLSSLGWAHAQASVAMESVAAAEALAERLHRSTTLSESVQAAVVGVPGVAAASSGSVEAVVSRPDVVVDSQQLPAAPTSLPTATVASVPASGATTTSLTHTAMRAKMVSGSLEVKVDNPSEFAASSQAEAAFMNSLAEVCGVAASYIAVAIEVKGRRLSAGTDLAGTVTVSYDITVPSSFADPEAATSVADMLAQVAASALSSEVQQHLHAQGIEGALFVVSIEAPTIEEITLTATTTTMVETNVAPPSATAAGARAHTSQLEGSGGSLVGLAVGCVLGTAVFLTVLCAIWFSCKGDPRFEAHASQGQKSTDHSPPAVAFAATVQQRDGSNEAVTLAADLEGGGAPPRRRKSARCVQTSAI